MIDRITRKPLATPTIPDSTGREVEALVKSIRLYYVPILPFKRRSLRALLRMLEDELSGKKQLRVV